MDDAPKKKIDLSLYLAFMLGLGTGLLFSHEYLAILLIIISIILFLSPKIFRKIKNYIKNRRLDDYIDLTKL